MSTVARAAVLKPRPPRVALGIPAYKAGKWISSCLDSILAQTVSDFEVVISDNCSPDDTYEICQAYAMRDSRIRVVRQHENVGIAVNHNVTFQHTSAPYFCWVSANDIYEPTFLERCLAVLESEPDVVLVAPRASAFMEKPGDGEMLAETRLPDVRDGRTRLYTVMSSMTSSRAFRGVYRRAAFDTRDPLIPMFGTDHLIVVGLATIGRIVQIDEPLYYERVSPGARTSAVPMHLRARHYEPQTGVACLLFHRARVIARYWGIAMRHSKGGMADRLAVVPAMLRVMYDLRWMLVGDVREFIGLVKGLLRQRQST